MSFININNKQTNPTATYSATVIREALLSVETKNTAKVDTLVESIDHDLTLSEALEFFTAKLSAMNALNVALINEATQKEQDALEDKRTFAIAVNVIKLDESMMSEIDILAQEAKDLADFTKTFFKEFGGKIKKTADSMEWVEELYTSSITEALAINERSITKIQKEYGEVVKDMTKTVTDWKSAEGDVKTQLLEKLRALTARKKELEAELDSAVMGKDRNVELSGAFESVVNEAASLVDEVTGKAVKLPYKTKDFRGDAITVKGFTEPHKSSSSGRIQTDQGEFFPGVAGVKIVGHKFESVVIESTIAEAKELSKKEVRDLKIKINNARTIGKYFTKDESEFLTSLFELEITEGNAFLGARAKAIEEDKEEFEFNGKTFKVTTKVNEGAVKRFEYDFNQMVKDIKRGYGWIAPDHVAFSWENSSDSIDFELVKGELYRRLIDLNILAHGDEDNPEAPGEYVKSLKSLNVKELVAERKLTWDDLFESLGLNEAAPKMTSSKETDNLLELRDMLANASKGGSGRYSKEFDKAKTKALRAIEQMLTYTKIGS